MKIQKSHLKELIRQSIEEIDFKDKEAFKKYDKKHKMRASTKVKIGGKETTVGQAIDVGGPSHASVPKKKSAKDIEKNMMKAADDANKKMNADEKEKGGKYKVYIDGQDKPFIVSGKNEKDAKRAAHAKTSPANIKIKKLVKVNEVKGRRFTVKEVRMWMKTLEENRYKKTYNSDCRRVAWMVNNEGVELSEMPKSMSKKWTKAEYGRERYLAKEFLKLKSEQMNEQKLRKTIKESIKKIMEAKIVKFEIPMKDKKKVQTIVKKLKLKDGTDYSIYGSGKTFEMELDSKHEDKVLELLMKMKIQVRG